MADAQDLSQITKQLKIDHEGGFNTLDILMGLSKGERKIIGIDMPLANVSDKLGDLSKIRGEQTTAMQLFQDDVNKIVAKKPNEPVMNALQTVRTALNNFSVKQELMQKVIVDLKVKMRDYTRDKTAGTLNPSEIEAKHKELSSAITQAKKELEDLQAKQKQLAAEITSKDSTLFRMIVSAAADLSMPTAIQQHLTQLKRN